MSRPSKQKADRRRRRKQKRAGQKTEAKIWAQVRKTGVAPSRERSLLGRRIMERVWRQS